ncbi:MAG: radical SAM protein [Acidobacteriota bacterium]|nr:radical SAM protein [Acidobacteriota bacterium]
MQALDLHGLDPRKRIASLFLTPLCDMNCRFCASETDFDAMSFDQAAALLGALKGRADSIVLGGGEPFLWPNDLEKLTCFAADLGFQVQVCTNGVNLPQGFEKISSISRYILPLESLDPGLHEGLRQLRGGGHHDLVLDRIQTLQRADRELTLSTVVTARNLRGLQDLAEWLVAECLSGLKLHAWHLYRFLPVGRGGVPNSQELAVDREAYLRACRGLKAAGLPFTVFQRDDMQRASTVEFFWFEKGRLRMGSGGTMQQRDAVLQDAGGTAAEIA